MIDSDLTMYLPEGTARNPEDYLVKLRDSQSIFIQVTQEYLEKIKENEG